MCLKCEPWFREHDHEHDHDDDGDDSSNNSFESENTYRNRRKLDECENLEDERVK